MSRKISSLLRTAAVLAAVSGFVFGGYAFAERKDPSSKKTDDPFLNGAPFTFEQLLKLVRQDAIPLHRRKEAILNRGVDGSLSPEEIEKLKAAGASEDLMKAIRSKAKPVAIAALPPAPKKEPLGNIALTCAPVDCDISLNGTALGPTKEGKLEISKLHPGKWVIDFNAKGFMGRQSTVTVEADKTVSVSATLEANRATLEAFGAELLKKVVDALSGGGGLQEVSSVQATGALTIWSREGASVRWTLLMRNNPDRALFQAKAGSILHEVAFIGSEFKASKNLKGQDAMDLPTDLGFIRDYQLPAILAKISDPQFKKMASHTLPAPDEEYPLVADNGTEKISIGLDGQMHPQKVRIANASGVGSTLITYSDYVKGEKGFYPKTVQIKPDGSQHGIEVRFDNVDLSPNLTANDFKLRGKAILNLGN